MPRLKKKTAPPKNDPSFRDHPVAKAIEELFHQVEDVELSAQLFVPSAAKIVVKSIEENRKVIKNGEKAFAEKDPQKRAHAIKELDFALMRADWLGDSQLVNVLLNGLFLSLFSSFDSFTGKLLEALFERKPELYDSLNRTLKVSELTRFKTVSDLKKFALQEEIEAFRRQSYVEQFCSLEAKFAMPLRKFPAWPDFVERSQRRNLFTHCDGVVSEQYIKCCLAEGYKFSNEVKTGARLELNAAYFRQSCEVIAEVGLKLTQTLWRKLLPQERDIADDHANHLMYSLLRRQKWRPAAMIGAYIEELPKRPVGISRLVFVVNHAIALANQKKDSALAELLKSVDWEATQNEFQLAYAILTEDYKEATKVMKRIGKEGEILDENSYHLWPLFYKFRSSKLFLKAYEEIYGYPYVMEAVAHAQNPERKLSTASDADRAKNGAPEMTNGTTDSSS